EPRLAAEARHPAAADALAHLAHVAGEDAHRQRHHQGGDEVHQNDAQRHHRQPVAPELADTGPVEEAPGAGSAGAGGQQIDGRSHILGLLGAHEFVGVLARIWWWARGGGHDRRTRGSTSAYSTSVRMLVAMKIAASSATIAWVTGKSLLMMWVYSVRPMPGMPK